MKNTRLVLIAVIAFFGLLIIGDAVFVVTETNQVIITQFGKPVGKEIVKPGLHLKTPLIQKVNSFEKRYLEWNGDSNQIPTKDKKFIWIDTYARWRISDPLVFFQRVRDERGAHSRIDDIVDGETRNAIAKFDLIEIVRTTNREFILSEELSFLQNATKIPDISVGRKKIEEMILEKSSAITPQFGVELIDVKIMRINYVSEVQQKVFDRMIAERQRIAAKYRSEGDGKSAEIRGQKERELKRIQSGAYRKAEEIKGKADAEAIRIYASAYNLDSEFYGFMKTLETYRKTIDSSTTFLMTTNSEYFKYLKKVK